MVVLIGKRRVGRKKGPRLLRQIVCADPSLRGIEMIFAAVMYNSFTMAEAFVGYNTNSKKASRLSSGSCR
jgi:hypothetical protein